LATRYQIRDLTTDQENAQATNRLLGQLDLTQVSKFDGQTLLTAEEGPSNVAGWRRIPSTLLPDYLSQSRVPCPGLTHAPRYRILQILADPHVEFVLLGSDTLKWVRHLSRDYVTGKSIHEGHILDLMGIPAYKHPDEGEETVVVYSTGARRFLFEAPHVLQPPLNDPGTAKMITHSRSSADLFPMLADAFGDIEASRRKVDTVYCSEDLIEGLLEYPDAFQGMLWGAEVIPVSNLPARHALVASQAAPGPDDFEVCHVVWT